MCGIAGIWFKDGENAEMHTIKKMTDSLVHRGPDAEGHWTNEKGLYLGHRRLSIIDLDIRSNQPFHYFERYTITFNGEIYNYIELREELIFKGYSFQTNSDTEVICAAYDCWGINCVKEFDGMFAFALFDSKSEQLFCARDRFGEKPFYYYQDENGFYFASEMKALWAIGVKKMMRQEMIYNYLVHDLVEDVKMQENTFYSDIFKLKNSHYFLIKKGEQPKQQSYYNPSIETTFKGTFEEAVEKFNFLFKQSVERRMRSDVAVGSSLSGGLDSSAVTAIMSQFKSDNYTFSAIFPNSPKDESHYIDIVSNHFHTQQNNCIPNEIELDKKIAQLINHQEEPFQSGSIFAQYEVYELAKNKSCTVLLDGQGADELLGGYFNYLLPYYFELKGKNDKKNFLKTIYKNQKISLAPTFKQYLQFKHSTVFKTMNYFKSNIKNNNAEGVKIHTHQSNGLNFITFPDLKESLRYSLMNQGLEKLLRFSDRNAMAHSIEVRLPFLSHHLVDFVLSLPSEYFFKNGWTKSILRNATNDLLPSSIVWREDKIGFEAPHTVWINSPLLEGKINEAYNDLLSKGIINNNYPKNWKVLILSNCLTNG